MAKAKTEKIVFLGTGRRKKSGWGSGGCLRYENQGNGNGSAFDYGY